MSRSGTFITLEGGEGAGKSTQIARLCDWWRSRGAEVLVTRQPGGSPLAEKIRELLLHETADRVDDLTELLLMFAARSSFLVEQVRPALARGVVVLCDRFTDSTFAYQGGGRGMDDDRIRTLANLVHGDLEPDLTFLLDLPVSQGLARAAERGTADRIEQEGPEFFERVRRKYLECADAEPNRFVVVDAAAGEEEVWRAMETALTSRFPA